ncbi:MAG: cysteine desulfurase [Methyloceanibacter sp.]|uniref:aminotransferase class V-fold PLP-dependent enzyme n=1 Tax=Methyloceanibacter sp. TaxID=1965321 RepID=UPI001DF69EE8|nr:cysteine desulfurase [Methyloceanibacter sp.]MCB1443586.1 cysteine desulfurase [Methyloceanibacter sp.]
MNLMPPSSDVPQSASFDVEAIRADFPILSETVHGKPLTYLDNGASAQKPRQVIETITRTYSAEYANVHRGLHHLSNLATANFEKARAKVRAFLNAAHDEEIIFTRNATEAINLVASSFGAPMTGEGDEILITIMEHHSNIVPWHFLRERQGAVLKWAPVADDGTFLLDEFEKLITPRTKMIAVTQMSNVLGTIVPVKEVVKIARAHGIPVLVDGAQGAVHLPVDVRDLDCDFYTVTGHKLYGPTGIGVLYGKKAHLETMRPYQGGGEMIGYVTTDEITYATPPHRFEAGTPAIVQAIGLGAAIDYVESVGRENIAAHEHRVLTYAMERLGELNWLKIYGRAEGKGSIISFEVDGAHPHDVSTVLDRYGVAVRAGTHCCEPLLARFGVTSTCRASFAMYNTEADVDRLVEALHKVRTMFA